MCILICEKTFHARFHNHYFTLPITSRLMPFLSLAAVADGLKTHGIVAAEENDPVAARFAVAALSTMVNTSFSSVYLPVTKGFLLTYPSKVLSVLNTTPVTFPLSERGLSHLPVKAFSPETQA